MTRCAICNNRIWPWQASMLVDELLGSTEPKLKHSCCVYKFELDRMISLYTAVLMHATGDRMSKIYDEDACRVEIDGYVKRLITEAIEEDRCEAVR